MVSWRKWTNILNSVMTRYFEDIVLMTLSILYGSQVFKFQEILLPYEVYSFAMESYITNKVVGITFVVVGFIRLLGLLLDSYTLQKISLISLTFLWTLYTISFYISLPPNTVWITSLAAVITCYKIAITDTK